MKICENCSNEHDGTFASGRFCSQKCSKGFSTKAKRKEINQKVSSSLTGRKSTRIYNLDQPGAVLEEKTCENPSCSNKFLISKGRKRIPKCCSRLCSAQFLQIKLKEKKGLDYNKNLRDIGRKGGFGKKGYTTKGVFFQSRLEESCFLFLDEMNIEYDPHKYLPDSSKVSDLFIPANSIWIELDGINREKKKKFLGKSYDFWIDKIKEYDSKQLKLKIFYDVESFKKWIMEEFPRADE